MIAPASSASAWVVNYFRMPNRSNTARYRF